MMSSEASFMPQSFFPHEVACGGPPLPYTQHGFAPQMMLPPHLDLQAAYCPPQQFAPLPYASFQVVPQEYNNPMCMPMPTESRFGAQQQQLVTAALDSCQQISHVLQCYQQGGEDAEFVRKAIESLVKKLKDKRVELDALITAVTSSGKQQTPCVTIQRSLDGRLQVAGRKGVPHVVYARIWRWPNVSKNELVKLAVCSIPSDHQDFICINPYHYERVVSNGMAPLDMKSLRIDPPDEFEVIGGAGSSSSRPDQQVNFCDWPNTSNSHAMMPNISIDYACSRPQYDLSNVQIPNVLLPESWCAVRYYELDTQVGEIIKVGRDISDLSIDGGMDPHGLRTAHRFCLGALSNVHRGDASDKCRVYIGEGVLLRYHASGQVTIRIRSQKPVFIRSGYLDYVNNSGSDHAHRFIASDEDITVFDLRWAYCEMASKTQSATNAMRAQAAAVAGFAAPSGMAMLSEAVAESSVDGMRRAFCTFSISFVKGWGSNRYPRASIKETPCWVEVQLDRPLQLLDLLLKNSGT